MHLDVSPDRGAGPDPRDRRPSASSVAPGVRRPTRRVLLSTAVVAAVAALPTAAPSASAGQDLCARFGDVETVGTVANTGLTEISGLVASGRHPGVLWTHNDSGGGPEVFAIGEDGADLGAYVVDGATATDWEDIARGPGPDPAASYLYLGDIGDNAARRDHVTVYRVPEPAERPAHGGRFNKLETITLRYPAGPADAEALLVDPLGGDLVIVTKSYGGRSRVLRAPATSVVDGQAITMTDDGTVTIPSPQGFSVGLPGTAVTGADITNDGSVVVLRTYQSVLAFTRAPEQTVADALRTEPCFAPRADEVQGEAVAFTDHDSALLTISEGISQRVHRVAVAPAAPPSDDPASGAAAVGTSSQWTRVAVAVATVLVVALLAWGGLAAARRRRSSR